MKTYTLGEMIRAKRLSKGYSMADFTRLTGITQPEISRMELGITIPKMERIKIISRVLNINDRFLREAIVEIKYRELRKRWGLE